MDYDVKGNLKEVKASLPEGVRLVAVSKFHPSEYIDAAYQEGQRIFGESHEQELSRKVKELPDDIKWHFIGHLQTNKVKYIAPYISMIDAVDSLKLLKEIQKQAAKNNRVIDVLLELHIAEEETKYGLPPRLLCTDKDSCFLHRLRQGYRQVAHWRRVSARMAEIRTVPA